MPKEVCKAPRRGELCVAKQVDTSSELPGFYLPCQKWSSFPREVLPQTLILRNPPVRLKPAGYQGCCLQTRIQH